MKTDRDAREFLLAVLGDDAQDHYIEAIMDDLREANGGSWDFDAIETAEFWRIVQDHQRPAGSRLND